MPRINETITLTDSVTLKAISPQNGQTPASYRGTAAGLPIAGQLIMNHGVLTVRTGNRHVNRLTASIIDPTLDENGAILYSDRVDIKVRRDGASSRTPAEMQEIIAGYVNSDEFLAALSGEHQF